MHSKHTPRFAPAVNSILAVAVALSLGGCQTTGSMYGARDSEMTRPADRLYARIPQNRLSTPTRKLTADGIKALDDRDYDMASNIFNLAVKTDITNSQLHLLNAYAYHQRARNGESALFPLAEQGYGQAVQFDQSNWVAKYYRGLLYLDQREYARAQASLADAALSSPNDPDLLYDLAVASYYAKDPK